MRVLITGASGYIGSLLLPRLLDAGHSVVALARDPGRVPGARAGGRRGPLVIRGNVLTGAGLDRALSEVDVAYYLIHSMESASAAGESWDSFAERERVAAERFASHAARAGVGRIVYLGGPTPGMESASDHITSRFAVEGLLLEAVPDSVVLRSSIVIGAGSRSFRLLVRLVERLRLLALPPWRRFRTQPIDARDVIGMLMAAAALAPGGGRTFEIAGPHALSYGEMIERLAELMMVPRAHFRIGVTFTPVAARLAAAIAEEDPELTLALMRSLEHGDLLPAPEAPLRAARELGVALHSFEAAVEHALREWESLERLRAR